jgi:L-lysine exporter family protein LysE/ArgO
VVNALALGLALGAITGMPLGIVNVAIVDAALARARHHALGLGLGGATADTVHAALAFLGIGRIVTAHPAWIRVLAIAFAIAMLGYAVFAWRKHHVARPVRGGSVAKGFASGLALTLPNPGALGGWATIATAVWPVATTTDAIAFALGVGIGSAVWFTVLGRLVARIRPDHPALRVVPRIALVLFVGIAIVGIARAFS